MSKRALYKNPSIETQGDFSNNQIEQILNHELPIYVLEKTVKEGCFSSIGEARIASKEWLKFVVLSLEHPHSRIGMWSDLVDEIWHAYLLHTHDYFAFSKNVLGIEYYHHRPQIFDENGVSNMPQDKGSKFRSLYAKKFGKLHPIWDTKTNNKSYCEEDESDVCSHN